MLRRLALASVALAIAACSSAETESSRAENVGEVSEALAAQCQANVRGVGTLDVETQYLPNVVHCENGGAPLEALKAQAIAARTYLYYKLETAGSIADGQGDQVYSCGSSANALQKQAVLDTAGIVLRYKSHTICAFYVAGGAASAPSCHGGSASTESYVTYNDGLSGAGIHQSTLGWVSSTNDRNRGCMSQLGSRCLANEGKTDAEILRFYYGDDIVLEKATGACVPAGSGGGGGGSTPPPPSGADAGSAHESSPPASTPSTNEPEAEPPSAEATPGSTSLGARGVRNLSTESAGCQASPARAGDARLAALALVLATLLLRRRARAHRVAAVAPHEEALVEDRDLREAVGEQIVRHDA